MLKQQVKIGKEWYDLEEIGKDNVTIWVSDKPMMIPKSMVNGHRWIAEKYGAGNE
jgi:hypothetical protein